MSRLWLVGLVATAGCINIQPDAEYCESDTALPPVAATPEFHRDVRPILREKCGRCHQADGIGGFSLDTFREALDLSNLIQDKVVSREMPPWMPADCCSDYQFDASLSADQIATIDEWVKAGSPEGAFVEPPPIAERGLSRVDAELTMAEPFLPVPPAGTLDETRCFLLDWPESETTYVTGLEVVPGNPGIVHHALVLVASEDQARGFEERIAEDERPGWACPGGIVSDFSGWLGGWTPGFGGADFPDGLGQKIEPGSKLILSVHYALHNNLGVPDQSTVRVKIDREPARQRKALAVFDPAWLVTGGMPVPAGDADVSHSYAVDPTLANGGNGYTLYAVNLHMHERGSRGSVSIIRKDGSRECLLQIDDWDHEWQDDYLFETPVQIRKGDRLLVECRWDNTEGNQLIINGVPEAPRDMDWDEDEEMCVAFLTATRTDGSL